MSVASIPNTVQSETGNGRKHRKRELPFWSQMIQNNKEDLGDSKLWRAAMGEFLGLLLLAFFTIAFQLRDKPSEVPTLFAMSVSVGFFVATMISALSTVSGGHINPAVSIAFLLANKITFVRFVVFVIFQTTGALAGAALLKAVVPTSFEGNIGLMSPAPDVTDGQALVMELIITFNLIFVILAIVDGGRVDVQGSVPLIVGLTVAVNIAGSGHISGGCMNPSRAFASAVITGEMKHTWIYWLGPMLGGALGAIVYEGLFSTNPWIHRIPRKSKGDNYDQIKLQDVSNNIDDDSEHRA